MTHIQLQTTHRRISHNQLGNWQRCPKKWEYIYVDKIVTKDTPMYFRKGALVHELLSAYDQFLQQGAIPGDPGLVDTIMQIAKDEYMGQWDTKDIEIYLSALLAVRRFIKDFSPTVDQNIKVIAVEEKFQVELVTPRGRTFILEGVVDRLYEKFGKLFILDRKTTGAAQHWTENQLLMDSQLLTYGALLRELGFKPYGFEIDSIVTYPYKNYNGEPLDKLFKRLTSMRNDAEMTFALEAYKQAIDSMFDVLESGGQVPYHFSKECSKCAYMPICLYTMKGIDTTVLRRANFKPRPEA